MADLEIESRLKKLYARALRLGIEKYLITNRCDEVLIEYNVDRLWNDCYKLVLRSSSVTILSPAYTGDHRKALGLFIENGIGSAGWLDGFIALLVDFAKWSEETQGKQPDLTPIVEALTELGCESSELKSLGSVAVSQNVSEKVDMGSKSTSRKKPIPSKPRLFIGSSREALRIAEAVHANLDEDFECTIWTQGVFGLSSANLESLEERLGQSDFAVLVVTPDDVTESRGSKSGSPRDNVIFELGLFMGALGRKRTFLVRPRKADIKIPSDLNGITAATYDENRSDGNLRAATGKACSDIKDAVNAARLAGDN